MAIVVKDRVQETTTTTGTANFVLGGATLGFQSFAAIGNGNFTYYAIADQVTGDWEVGYGQYSTTGPTLTRTTVLSSSAAGAKVSFSAGSKQIFCTYPSEKAIYEEASGNVLIDGGPITVVGQGVTGYTTFSAALGEMYGDINGFAQFYAQNLNDGSDASADIVAYNDIGDGTNNFIDMGINSSNYTSVAYPIFTPRSGYLYNDGGELIIGSATDDVVLFAGGVGTTNEALRINKTTRNLTASGALSLGGTLGVTGAATFGSTVLLNANPTLALQAATKQYVDSAVSTGFVIHPPVVYATIAALPANTYNNGASGVGATLTAVVNGALSVDSTAVTAGQRILVRLEAAQANNGVYTVTQTGSGILPYILTRATDFDTAAAGEIANNAYFFVTSGPTQAGDSYVLSQTAAITVGTTALPFTLFADQAAYTGGTNITVDGQVISLSGTVAATLGGTGTSTVTTGDLLYGSGTNTWAKLAAGAGYKSLVMNAGGTLPEWNAVALNQSGAVSGTLPATNGGTGQDAYAVGDTLYSGATNTLAKLTGNTSTTKLFLGQTGTGSASAAPVWQQPAAGDITGLAASATTDTTNAINITSGTLPALRLAGSYTGVTGVGTLSVGTWNASTITAAYGGTGQTSYTVGDLLYASTSSVLSRLADVATGNALISGGVGAAPSWGKIGMATHVSGTLPIGNGGTNTTATPTTNGVSYGTGTAYAFTAAGTTGQVLKATTGSAPSWGQVSLTADISGTLLVGNGGTGATTFTAGIPYVNGTSAFTTATAGQIVTAIGVTAVANATTAVNQSGGTVSATTGSFSSRVIISTAGRALTVGGSPSGTPNTSIATQNSYLEIAAGSGGATNSGGLIYHNPGVSTAVLEYVNTSSSVGYFNFRSDNPTWNARVNGNEILTAGNYTTYAPSLTGSGASGTWGINVTGSSASCTGNAATATNLSTTRTNWSTNGTITAVVGQLAWKNYGNSHTIFDASAGTSPDGTPVNNTNSAAAWAGTYPTLMGWNGGQTFGVRVDSARVADSAPANGGNSSTVGGFGPSQTSGASNRIVVTDVNGYIFNNYINTTDNSVASGVSAVMVKQGDNYYRSGTAAAVASFISGQSMSISGSATFLNSSNYINQRGSSGSWNSDFQNTPAGSASYGGDVGANGTNGPGGSWWIQQNFRHTNGGNVWGTQVAWGWEDNANRLATRNVTGGIFGGWVYYLNSANVGSYALPIGGGTLTTGANSNLFIGRNSVATAYNAISLNGNSGDSPNMGLTGGGGSDTTLYVNAPGEVRIRTNSFGQNFFFNGSGFTNPNRQYATGGIQIAGDLILQNSGATYDNSTGARMSESYGPYWNLGNGATWHFQIMNGSLLVGISAGGTNYGSGNIRSAGQIIAGGGMATGGATPANFFGSANPVKFYNPSGSAEVLIDAGAGAAILEFSASSGSDWHLQNSGGVFYFTQTSVADRMYINGATVVVPGTLSKGSGTFDIPHPAVEGKRLRHSFVEGPRVDLIYRGHATLVNGTVTLNMDTDAVSEGGQTMTPGTFVALTRDADIFVQNLTGWEPLKASIDGATLTIVCKDSTSTDTVSWMVVAERQDDHLHEADIVMTDDQGRMILEYVAEPLQHSGNI